MERIKVERGESVGIDLLEIEWNYRSEFGEDACEFIKKYDVWNFSLENYRKAALEKWEAFVANQVQRADEIILLDSSIFQFQIYTFLLANASFEQIEDFLRKVFAKISIMNPALIYLYRKNVEDTIQYLEQDRGSEFLERIWERDQHQPYYAGRPRGL